MEFVAVGSPGPKLGEIPAILLRIFGFTARNRRLTPGAAHKPWSAPHEITRWQSHRGHNYADSFLSTAEQHFVNRYSETFTACESNDLTHPAACVALPAVRHTATHCYSQALSTRIIRVCNSQ